MSANGVHEEKRDRDCGGEESGPGPVVLRSARLRLAFVECVSAEDLEDVVHGLVIAAREGSVSAARLLLKYVFDKKALAEAEKVAESAGAWEFPLTPDPSPPRGEGRMGGVLSDPGRGEGRMGGGLSDPGRNEGRSDVYEEDGDFPLTPDPSPPRGEGRMGCEESGKAVVIEERSGRGPMMHVDLARLYQEAEGKLEKELEMIPWDEIRRLMDDKDGPGLSDGEPATPCADLEEMPGGVGESGAS